jgi:hypothetical protein
MHMHFELRVIKTGATACFIRSLAFNHSLQWGVMIIIDPVKIKADISTGQNPRCSDVQSDYRLEKINTASTGRDRPSRLTSAAYMNGNLNT